MGPSKISKLNKQPNASGNAFKESIVVALSALFCHRIVTGFLFSFDLQCSQRKGDESVYIFTYNGRSGEGEGRGREMLLYLRKDDILGVECGVVVENVGYYQPNLEDLERAERGRGVSCHFPAEERSDIFS